MSWTDDKEQLLWSGFHKFKSTVSIKKKKKKKGEKLNLI